MCKVWIVSSEKSVSYCTHTLIFAYLFVWVKLNILATKQVLRPGRWVMRNIFAKYLKGTRRKSEKLKAMLPYNLQSVNKYKQTDIWILCSLFLLFFDTFSLAFKLFYSFMWKGQRTGKGIEIVFLSISVGKLILNSCRYIPYSAAVDQNSLKSNICTI